VESVDDTEIQGTVAAKSGSIKSKNLTTRDEIGAQERGTGERNEDGIRMLPRELLGNGTPDRGVQVRRGTNMIHSKVLSRTTERSGRP